MAIQVTCPSCLKRFTVSDKFAGRTGPCPSCQKPIKIPEKAEEVVIHAPADDGPKDASGKSILKPIRRKEVALSLPVILGASLSAVVVLGIAFGIGLSGEQLPTAVLAVGSFLLALPLVFIGYWFLQDDELEGFSGQQLLLRTTAVAIAFAGLWALYAYVPCYVSGYSSMSEYSGMDMFIAIAVMIVVGTLVGVAALELEVPQAVMLYMLYFAITFIVAWLAGTQLGGPLSGDNGAGTPIPPATAPQSPGPADADPATGTEPSDSSEQLPKLLQ